MHTAAVSKQTRTIAYMSLYFELIFVPSLSTAESSKRIKKSSEISFCKVMGNKKEPYERTTRQPSFEFPPLSNLS